MNVGRARKITGATRARRPLSALHIVGAQHQHKQLSAMSKCHDGSRRGGGRSSATVFGYCCRYGSAARRKPRLVDEYRRFALDGKFWSAIRVFMGTLRDEAHTSTRLCQLLERTASTHCRKFKSGHQSELQLFGSRRTINRCAFHKTSCVPHKDPTDIDPLQEHSSRSRRNWNCPAPLIFIAR
jgi:hypothetical protein